MEIDHKPYNYLLNKYGIDFTNIKNAIELLFFRIKNSSIVYDRIALLNIIDEIHNIYVSNRNDDIIDDIIIDLTDIASNILSINYIDTKSKKKLLESINEIVRANYTKYINNYNFVLNYINIIIKVLNECFYNTEELSNISNLIIDLISYVKEQFKNEYTFVTNSIRVIDYIFYFGFNLITDQSKQKIIDTVLLLTDKDTITEKNNYNFIQTTIHLIHNILFFNNTDINIVKKLFNNFLYISLDLDYNNIQDSIKIVIIKLFQCIIDYDLVYHVENFQQSINYFINNVDKKINNIIYMINFINFINNIKSKYISNINNKQAIVQIEMELFVKNYYMFKHSNFFCNNLVKFTNDLITSNLVDIDRLADLININFDLIITTYNTFQEYNIFWLNYIELVINILNKTNNNLFFNKEVIVTIINHTIINYSKIDNICFKYKFINLLNIVLEKTNDVDLMKNINKIGFKFLYDNTNIIDKFNNEFVIKLLHFNSVLIDKNVELKIIINNKKKLINNEIQLLRHINKSFNSIMDYNAAPFLIYVLNNIINEITNKNINDRDFLINFGSRLIMSNQYILEGNDLFVNDSINFIATVLINFKINLSNELINVISNFISTSINKLKLNNTVLNNSIYFIDMALKQQDLYIFAKENMINNLTKLIIHTINNPSKYPLSEFNKKNIINLLFKIFNKKTNNYITDNLIYYGIHSVIEYFNGFNKDIDIVLTALELSLKILQKIDKNIDNYHHYPRFLIDYFKKSYKNYNRNKAIINNTFKLILNISHLKLEQTDKLNIYSFAIDFIALHNKQLIFDDCNLLNNTFVLISNAIRYVDQNKNKFKLSNKLMIDLIQIFLDKFANKANDFSSVDLLVSTIKNSIPPKEEYLLSLLKQQEEKLIFFKNIQKIHNPASVKSDTQNNTLQLMTQFFEQANTDMNRVLQSVRRINTGTINAEQYISDRRTDIANENNNRLQQNLLRQNKDTNDSKPKYLQ